MASSDPKPAPITHAAEPSQAPQPLQAQSLSQLDPAQFLLMQQQLDPTIQLFIQQQLTLCNQDQLFAKQQQLERQQQQQQQQANTLAGINVDAALSGSINGINLTNVTPPTPSLSLQQHIQAQKEQQARFLQLQQLMALNLKQQRKNTPSKSNNFRASAA